MKISPVLVVTVLASGAASADDVFLKGAGKISGRVLRRTATSVEMEIGAGKIAVPANRVERIVEGQSALDAYYQRAGALSAKDGDGWRALGRWSSDNRLPSQSREAYRRALAIDPSDTEANAGAGNVRVAGRWMPEEEAYKARGYVKFQAQWMMPHERAAHEAAVDTGWARAAAENRARQAEAQASQARVAEAAALAKAAAAPQQPEGIPLWWGWGQGPLLWPTQPVVPYPRVR
jgi:tetratricopeptide (TPR) repeat protein